MAGKGVVEHEQKQKKSSSSFCGSRNDNGDGCQPGSGSEYRYFQRRNRICKCGSRRNTTGDHSFRLAEEFCISRRLK